MTPEKLKQMEENRGFLSPEFERRKRGIASDFEFASKINPEESQAQLDNRMAGILQNTPKDDATANEMLKSYRTYREGRGEKPLQYLESFDASNRARRMGEQIPFFNKLFTEFESAFPESERASIAAGFDNSAHADKARQMTANKMFVSAMTDSPVSEISRNWNVARTLYARQALGWQGDGTITEEDFHGLAASMIGTELSNRNKTNATANRARAAIIKGEDSEKMIAALPPEYREVASQVQTDFLTKFDDTEIALAKALYDRDTSDAKPTGDDEKATKMDLDSVYGSLSVDRRDAVRSLIGMLAQDDGWTVEDFWARTYASVAAGGTRIQRGMQSTAGLAQAADIQRILDMGSSALTLEEMKDPDQLRGYASNLHDIARNQKSLNEHAAAAPKLDDEQRAFLTGELKRFKGQEAYYADMAAGGTSTARFLREEQDGFWMRSWLMASGSLPEMGLAMLPSGTGLPIIMASRRAEAKSNYQRIAPGADEATIDRMATTTALGQTATMAMERFILGARLPKTTASLAAVEHSILNMSLRGGWRTAAAAVPRVGLVVGLEQIQENTENLIPALVQGVSSALSEDIPGVNWTKVYEEQKAVQGDIFGASLIFGIIAGGGRAVSDYVQAPKLRETLMDSSGMRLSGLSQEDAAVVNELAETQPATAAEEYQKRLKETPMDTRRNNSMAEAARLRQQAQDAEVMRRAGLPEMSQLDTGRVRVKWNDVLDNESEFDTPEEAQAAMNKRELQESVDLTRSNRADLMSMIREDADAEVLRLQAGLPADVRLDVQWIEPQTMEEWAGTDSARIAQARERIKIHMRKAANDMGLDPEDIDLSAYIYQGSSRNIYEGGITTIAVELAKGGKIINGKMQDPASAMTVLEEVSEGLSKYVRSKGVKLERQAGWVRSVEKGTGQAMLPDGFDLMNPEAQTLAVDEALSDIAVGYSIGRVSEEAVPSGLISFLRGFKEMFGAVIRTAKGITRFFKDGGEIDPQFREYLDMSAGLSETVAFNEASAVIDAEMNPDESTTFAVATAAENSIASDVAARITDEGQRSDRWKGARKRLSDIAERYDKAGTPASWLTSEEQEAALIDLDQRRTEEFERHDMALDEIEMDLASATQEARAGLMGELGDRWMNANGAHRNTLRRLMTERENTVRQKHLRRKDAEMNAHRKNIAALNRQEKSLMDRGRQTERDMNRFQQIRDIATLEAIAKALPAAIRGKSFSTVDENGKRQTRSIIGAFRKITDLPTAAKREAYIRELIPMIDGAIETHLQGEFKAAIKKRLDAGRPDVSDSRTATGKITAEGHDLLKLAESAMTIKPENLDAEVEKLQLQLDNADGVDMEFLESIDTQMAILEAFYDYENASSYRLEGALATIDEIYANGRRAWLEVIASRKERQQYIVESIAKGMGIESVDTADRAAARRKNEGLLNKLSEGFMSAMISGHQTIRRLGEMTTDPEVKAILETFERDLYEAELAEQDGNRRDQEALTDAIRSIFKVSTEYSAAKKLRELTTAPGEHIPVTKVTGRTADTEIKIPIKAVEAIVRGEVSGFEYERRKNQVSDPKRVDLTPEQIDLLKAEWFDFQQLPEEQRKGKQTITITEPGQPGERKSLGDISQLEALQFLLTIQQPDQSQQAEDLGYDAQTLAELQAWLKPEVVEFGQWMVDYLRADQGTIDAIHRAEKGVGLGLVDKYFPIRREVAGMDARDLDLNGMGPQQSGKSVAFIKARVDNRADIAIANAIGVFMAHRAQVNFWKSHVAPIRVWGGVVKSERFASVVKAGMGEKYYGALSTMMKRVESGGRLNATQQMDAERLVKGLMKNFSLGTLGGRVSTLLVNTSAVLNATFEVPAGELMKGAALVMKRPEAFRDAWNSPPIQRRLAEGSSFEAQLAKSRGPSDNPILALLNRTAEYPMEAINYVDTTANVVGAVAAWEYHRKQAERAGLNPEQAKRLADEKVDTILRRAAQPTTRLSKSNIELLALDSPMSALLSVFISEPRKNMAIVFMAARKLVTGKGDVSKSMAFQQLAVGLVLYVAAEYVLRSVYSAFFQAKPEDEDEAWKRLTDKLTDPKAIAHKLAVSHIGGIPLVGPAWDYAMAEALGQQSFDSSNNPLVRVPKALKQIGPAINSEKTASERIDATLKVVQGLGSAVPGGPLFSQAANVLDAATGAMESNGVHFSEESKVDRFKGRFNSAVKKIDEQYGKSTKEVSGKKVQLPEVMKAKSNAKVESLVNMLQGLPESEARKILDAVDIGKSDAKRVMSRLGK